MLPVGVLGSETPGRTYRWHLWAPGDLYRCAFWWADTEGIIIYNALRVWPAPLQSSDVRNSVKLTHPVEHISLNLWRSGEQADTPSEVGWSWVS